MAEIPSTSIAQEGDLAQLIDARGREYILRLHPEGRFQTNRGQILTKDLIGLPWGSVVLTHLKNEYIMMKPSLHDVLINTKRHGTIMYPKDMGFIMLNMNLVPGKRIIEAGTGSGAFTIFLASIIGEQGHVYSYDLRTDMQSLAQKNLKSLGLLERVTFKNQDIAFGFDENEVDAIFLDLPNPEDYISQVREALRLGGFFGSLLPTTNQVSELLAALVAHDFALTEVCENMLRYYKPIPDRLRPDDRMIAHTGFLIFARPLVSRKGQQE